jgi:hypothetical protein
MTEQMSINDERYDDRIMDRGTTTAIGSKRLAAIRSEPLPQETDVLPGVVLFATVAMLACLLALTISGGYLGYLLAVLIW